jgi:hypothetical protein
MAAAGRLQPRAGALSLRPWPRAPAKRSVLPPSLCFSRRRIHRPRLSQRAHRSYLACGLARPPRCAARPLKPRQTVPGQCSLGARPRLPVTRFPPNQERLQRPLAKHRPLFLPPPQLARDRSPPRGAQRKRPCTAGRHQRRHPRARSRHNASPCGCGAEQAAAARPPSLSWRLSAPIALAAAPPQAHAHACAGHLRDSRRSRLGARTRCAEAQLRRPSRRERPWPSSPMRHVSCCARTRHCVCAEHNSECGARAAVRLHRSG